MTLSRCSISLSLATAWLCLSFSSARAQWRDNQMGFNFNNPMSSLAATMVMNKAREDAMAKSLGASPNSPRTSGTASASQPGGRIDDTALRFRSAGTYIKTRELADQLGSNPAEREQYLKIMNAVLDAFGAQTEKLGFKNDIAAALAYFFGQNIRIYRGLPDLPDQQYVNLRNMIAGALAAGGGLGNATDRQKQEMYETLVAYTGITQFGYEQAKQAGQDQMAKGYQQVAGQNLQTVTKLSPDTMSLTGGELTVANPANSVATTQPDSAPAPSRSFSQGVSATLTAAELSKAFADNEVRANQLYTGKRVRISGWISGVQLDPNNGRIRMTFPILPSNNPVVCYFNQSDSRRIVDMKRDDQVTAEGTVIGYKISRYAVSLENCTIP